MTYDNGNLMEYYPSEMPELFLRVIDSKDAEELNTTENKEAITEVLHNLVAIAENPHNSKGYKLLYQLLDSLAKEIDYNNITNKWRN